MKWITNIVLWALGILFLLISMVMLISSFVGSMCFLVVALICLPPVRKRYLSSFKWQTQAISAFFLVLVASVASSTDTEKTVAKNQVVTLADIQEENTKKAANIELTPKSEESSMSSIKELEEKNKKAQLQLEKNRQIAKEKSDTLRKQKLISLLENKTKNTDRAGELVNLYQELMLLDPENKIYEENLKKYKAMLIGPLKVIGVSDGDSITVLTKSRKKISVRLYGVDAPELGQEYGRKSKDRLGNLLKDAGKVFLEDKGKDQHGRVFAYIYLPDLLFVNKWSLREGCSWHHKRVNSDPDLAQDESYARKNKVGLWAGYNPMSPAKYRKRQLIAKKLAADKKKQELARQKAARKKQTRRKTQPVGNTHWLNSKSGVRHNRGCRWYGSTSSGRPCGANEGRACSKCGG